MPTLAVVLAAASLLVAACSGGSDADPSTTPEPAPTVAPTTEAPTTTSTVAPTTAAPTTTEDHATTLAAQVEADLLEALAAGRRAEMDPFDAAAEAVAIGYRVGFAQASLASRLADWRAMNYAIRENPEVPPSVVVEVPASLVGQNSDVVEVTICEIDSWVLVEVGAGPQGDDAVVSPDVLTYRTRIFLRSVDDAWRIEGASEIDRWEGATTCDESS